MGHGTFGSAVCGARSLRLWLQWHGACQLVYWCMPHYMEDNHTQAVALLVAPHSAPMHTHADIIWCGSFYYNTHWHTMAQHAPNFHQMLRRVLSAHA